VVPEGLKRYAPELGASIPPSIERISLREVGWRVDWPLLVDLTEDVDCVSNGGFYRTGQEAHRRVGTMDRFVSGSDFEVVRQLHGC
jgi:hypothetical protein